MVEFSVSNCNLLFLDSTKISCFPILALKQDVTCLDNIMEEKEETWWIRDQLSMWGRAARGNCGPLCEPAPWSQSQGTRGDGRVNNCIFHGHVSVWVCAAERWQIVPSMATMRALFACQQIGVNLIRSKLFVDVCTCLEQWGEEGNRIL